MTWLRIVPLDLYRTDQSVGLRVKLVTRGSVDANLERLGSSVSGQDVISDGHAPGVFRLHRIQHDSPIHLYGGAAGDGVIGRIRGGDALGVCQRFWIY